MADGVLPVSDFGGLDIVSSPDQSACIDMLNVDLDVRGALRSRDGFDNFTTSGLTNQPDSVFAFTTSDGTKRLLVGNGNRIDALDTTGASQANTTDDAVVPTASPHYFVRFGGPTAEAVYYTNGTDGIGKFTADTFSSAGVVGSTYKFVAVTPTSNRLAIAHKSGSTAGQNPSSVDFSEPGLPESFTGSDFVDLDPGDGEGITGMSTWGNYLFVFKPSKFFVFYGESTDIVGGAVFNYRKMDSGIGSIGAMTTARDGVYFLSRSGVYRTTGGQPDLVSGQLDPLFRGSSSEFYLGDDISQTYIENAAMHFHNERIYLAVTTGAATTNNRMFVYDPRYDEWLDWDIPAAALATFSIGDSPELVFARPTGSNYIDRHSSSYTSDDGASITSRYRTGFTDFGAPGAEKDIHSTRLWGTGTVAVSGSRDFGDLDTAANATLGTSPDVAAALHNKQKKGELVSYQFADASGGAWKLHRYAHYPRGVRPPGIRSD